MEICSNEFEILINLPEDIDGVGLNNSPLVREFPELSIPWKEKINLDTVCEDPLLDVFSDSFKNLRSGDSEASFDDHGNRPVRSTVRNDGGENVQIVNGADIGDVPVEYHIKGLDETEFPVKGFYVDKRIVPGFKYSVRLNGGTTWLFRREARTLESVGMGYGKRLTFSGGAPTESITFWSDNNPDGYAFRIHVVGKGDEFVICDKRLRPLGRAYINGVIKQQEISMSAGKGGVTKHVRVMMSVFAEYQLERHGMLPLVGGETAVVEGIAVVTKRRKERKAITIKIEQINLPKIGLCSLRKEL